MGVGTAAYGVGTLARPALLAKPCGLTEADGSVSAPTALLVRAMGARDTAIGAAMILAGTPSARRTATACRVASDLADAALFGSLLPDRAARRKAAAVAGAWGVLCALAAVATDGSRV
ncbi:hypothetical protein [Streptomyces sp. NPDC088785]|uniref:hypothetical protein n=1 Tax=Streptomyces sp. NPDC088785 TaxID=3365897 RepID=UPI0037F6EFD0